MFSENRFLQWICISAAAAFLIAAYHPDTEFDWALENALVFFGVAMLILTYRQFQFSDFSYLVIFLFLCLHEYGAHYKYSDVPLGEWMKPWLHTQRNHYDRICHFSFGFLLSYPMREVCIRALRVTGKWRYYLPVECTLAFSSIYEMMEAGMATILSPQRGEEFVGMQGDIWDSQEDMFMAGLGSVVAMTILYQVQKRRAAAADERLAAYAATPE